MIRALRAYPTLLRIGLAEAVAYRAEFFIWMLTTTMPLVSLAIWRTVAADAPVGRFGQRELTGYFLGMLIVRMLTGTWVVWEMNQEIRSGTLAMRLLRPIHPIIAYSAEHLAAIPLRAAVALPIAVALFFATSGDQIVSDPLQAALLPVVLAFAWIIMFTTMFMIGTLGLFMEKSIAIFEVWWGMMAILGGYLFPLEVVSWLPPVAKWLPFRYLMSFPVETGIGMMDRAAFLEGFAIQAGWVAVCVAGALLVWRAGVRRFEAFGS